MTNHLSELSVAGGRGSTGAVEESDSSSESSSDSESAVLERAKVEGLDLELLEVGPDGKAPLELISQVYAMHGALVEKFSPLIKTLCMHYFGAPVCNVRPPKSEAIIITEAFFNVDCFSYVAF